MPLIMIVEDSVVTAKMIAKFLNELGCSSVHMADGVKAIEYFKAQKTVPDGILMDWNMPYMTGYECFVKLKEMAIEPFPKVIFCTTENEVEKIMAVMQQGASEYIMKPFDRDILEEKFQFVGLL